jgi:hypothetical protein
VGNLCQGSLLIVFPKEVSDIKRGRGAHSLSICLPTNGYLFV